MKLITPEQMREAERLCDARGITYAMLAENAGRALAEFIIDRAEKKTLIAFLCGNGNNACDGFEAARFLAGKGFGRVAVILLSGMPKTEIAKAAFEKIKGRGDIRICTYDSAPARNIAALCGVMADCVFGTGFRGALPAHIAEFFAIKPVKGNRLHIAADIPSGADGMSGSTAQGCFRADYTLAFGLEKTGTRQYPALLHCGKTIVADIGIPSDITDSLGSLPLLSDDSLSALLPARKKTAHKGDFGSLLCICGSGDMPGAAVLSASAALRCGAGIVTAASVPSVCAAVSAGAPEALLLHLNETASGHIAYENYGRLKEYAEKASALLIGCGLGVSGDTKKLVRELIQSVNCPIILDADGINCIADSINIIREARSGILLTPHPGEMARLTGKTASAVQSDRIRCAMDFAAENGCAVLLKGAATILAAKATLRINPSGNPGMSRGGSGDVLAGMAAAFAAQGMRLDDAGALAAYMHGRAGDAAAKRLSEYAMLPSDIIANLPAEFLRLTGESKIPASACTAYSD